MSGELRVLDALAGKRILVTGATGFLGKVTVSMLLYRQPGIGRVFVLVRPSDDKDARARFRDLVKGSPAFEPLRAEHEDEFEAFLDQKVEVLSGKISDPDCGLSGETLSSLSGNVDLVLNTASLIAMHAGLDEAFRINTLGARNVANLAGRLGAKLVHVSTAYVAGGRSGAIPENEPIAGSFPLRGKLASQFQVDREISECERFLQELKSRANDPKLRDRFREEAIAARRKRDAVDEASVERSVTRRARRWVDQQLVTLGSRRARHWGWPNVYCYTRAMGEQTIDIPGLDYAVVRPAIVESAMSYPTPGWNEGMHTSAPAVYAMLRGHILWPVRGRYPVDIVPVDLVGAATLAVCAAVLEGDHERVYHLGTSDTNPLLLRRCLRYISQYRRKHYKEFERRPGFLGWARARIGVLRVPYPAYQSVGAPSRRLALSQMIAVLEKTSPTGVPKTLTKLEREFSHVERIVREFLPFIHDGRYVFQSENIRRLYGRMRPQDIEALPWNPEKIRWRRYWQDVHIEGLRRWVFPHGSRSLPRGAGPKLHEPGLASRAVRSFLSLCQEIIYGSLFDTRACGAVPIPTDRRFVVAGNHASHLDMGLIKHAMGPAGKDLSPLAATDYFFKNPIKRFYFKNFTNLIPWNRDRSFKDSILLAGEALRRGRNVLIFPEGGRSLTGQIKPFKPSVGYLVLRNQVDVLPVFLQGTREGWPKGKTMPNWGRLLTAHFGAPIPYEELHRQTEHLPQKEAYRAVTAVIEEAVRRLEQEHAAERGL